jgi:hypothetical protein
MKKYIFSLALAALAAGIYAQTDKALERRSDPSRFSQIKLNPTDAKKELEFWPQQLGEHALFLALGLQPDAQNKKWGIDKLKSQGFELNRKFMQFVKQYKANPQIAPKILPLTKQLRDYKVQILKDFTKGWSGWIYPTLVKHMILELDYFIDRLQNKPISPAQEIAFWNLHNKQASGATAHLLDPDEEKLVNQALDLAKQYDVLIKSNKEEDIMREISLKFAHELDAYAKKIKPGIIDGSVKSVLHPLLLEHEGREVAYGTKKLEALKK